jgi:Zn ribbon nucleic-acid-binding protein
MSDSVQADCPVCNISLIYLVWRDGKIVIVAECSNCENQITFDLESMKELLGEENSQSKVFVHQCPITLN